MTDPTPEDGDDAGKRVEPMSDDARANMVELAKELSDVPNSLVCKLSKNVVLMDAEIHRMRKKELVSAEVSFDQWTAQDKRIAELEAKVEQSKEPSLQAVFDAVVRFRSTLGGTCGTEKNEIDKIHHLGDFATYYETSYVKDRLREFAKYHDLSPTVINEVEWNE